MQLVAAGAAPVMWILMKRAWLHRHLAIASGLVSAVALVGLMTLPHLAPLWAGLFGFGTGAGVILGLTFVGLRAVDTAQAAALSGMAQCAGYLMAAIGPVAIGALHDASGSWSAPIAVCIVLAIAMAAMGALAGRAMHITRDRAPSTMSGSMA
jgi:CP family cyanate transporter-like MFS transporter